MRAKNNQRGWVIVPIESEQQTQQPFHIRYEHMNHNDLALGDDHLEARKAEDAKEAPERKTDGEFTRDVRRSSSTSPRRYCFISSTWWYPWASVWHREPREEPLKVGRLIVLHRPQRKADDEMAERVGSTMDKWTLSWTISASRDAVLHYCKHL
jgi:hypothetical protein